MRPINHIFHPSYGSSDLDHWMLINRCHFINRRLGSVAYELTSLSADKGFGCIIETAIDGAI